MPEDAEGRQFVGRYGAVSYPRVLFLDPDGSLVGRIRGFVEPVLFAERMHLVLSSRGRQRAYLAEAAGGNFRNAVALFRMLEDVDCMDVATWLYDVLRSSSVLTESEVQHYAVVLAEHYLDSRQYDVTLEYLRIAEHTRARCDTAYNAYLLHAMALYWTEGVPSAVAYLGRLIEDASVPIPWRESFRDVSDSLGGME